MIEAEKGVTMLQGILPILFIPFKGSGEIDEPGLKRLIQFELETGVHGLGINGFSSEAYKLSPQEQARVIEILATEVAGQVPLIFGVRAESMREAAQQLRRLRQFKPAVFMTLPPDELDKTALQNYYIDLSWAVDIPLMIRQESPLREGDCRLSVEDLAAMTFRADGIQYFKFEGEDAPQKMDALHKLIGGLDVAFFGSSGGLNFLAEAKMGASGLLPGAGFNEIFMKVWHAYEHLNIRKVRELLLEYHELIAGVSSRGYEFSLHARKQLMKRAGYIETSLVRGPTIPFTEQDAQSIFAMADKFNLRIARK